MKLNSFAVLCLMTSFTFNSCKHEIIEPESQPEMNETIDFHSHLTGNFLVETIESSHYDDSYYHDEIQTFDEVISLYIENDSLCFNDYKISIDSVNQTSFIQNYDGYLATISIEFLNDFNDLEIMYDFNTSETSPSHDLQQTGSRTSSQVTNSDNLEFTQFNGEYLLTRTYWDNSNGETNIETDTFQFSRSVNQIVIGNDIFDEFTMFHQNSHESISSTFFEFPRLKELEIQLGDSLKFYRYTVTETEEFEFDSVLIQYTGVPL